MKEPLRIAICEDDIFDRNQLTDIIDTIEIPTKCTVYENGEDFLKDYKSGEFDLILTDIYMSSMTGVELISKIRQTDKEVSVGFVTSSTDFALQGYRLSVLKYIEKPVRKSDLEDIIKLALLKKENAPSIIIRKNGKEEKILLSHIIYLEQQTHKINIHQDNETTIQIYEKLSTYMTELLKHDFFFSHKSYCVNFLFVNNIDEDLRCFVMNNGDNVPIRRESMGKAKKMFEEFLFNHTRSIE